MTQKIQPLLVPKLPEASPYPPAVHGKIKNSGGQSSGALLNFLTVLLDANLGGQLAMIVVAVWAEKHPFDSYQAQRDYLILFGLFLAIYFVIFPIVFRATLGRLMLRFNMFLGLVMGIAFLVFTTTPLLKSLKVAFDTSPVVVEGKKIMAGDFNVKDAVPVFLYFTPTQARILFLMGNKPTVLPLVNDGQQWKYVEVQP